MDRSYRDAIGNVDAVTPFMQMFDGTMVQRITCTNCSKVSTSLQPFSDIGLDIGHVRTVNDAINHYFKAKKLDEGSKKTNVYKCTACQRNVEATQKFSISKLPPVLCLQLKRFGENNIKLIDGIKISKNLDLSPYFDGSVGSKNYSLSSFIIHHGSSRNAGHYTAICKNTGDNNFFHFNDETVTSLSEEQVLQRLDSYVIFYEAVSTSDQSQNISNHSNVEASLPSTSTLPPSTPSVGPTLITSNVSPDVTILSNPFFNIGMYNNSNQVIRLRISNVLA